MAARAVIATPVSPRGPSVILPLGQGSPTDSGGVGGWEVVARARRRGLTDWTGIDPFRLTVPVMFDGFRRDRSVEDDVADMQRLALPVGDGPPPVLRLQGPVPHTDLRWVVDKIEWGESLRLPSGKRCRQPATVTFLQHVATVLDVATARTAAQRAKATAKTKREAVRQGESLRDVLTRLGMVEQLVTASLLNQIRDPRAPLRTGRLLTIPGRTR